MGQRATSTGSSPKKNSPRQSTVSDSNDSHNVKMDAITHKVNVTVSAGAAGTVKKKRSHHGGKSQHARQVAATKNHARGVERGYILGFD